MKIDFEQGWHYWYMQVPPHIVLPSPYDHAEVEIVGTGPFRAKGDHAEF